MSYFGKEVWPVQPICPAQKLDVRPEDLLDGGLYRRCNTYRSGGGYDQFPGIYRKRTGTIELLSEQFVVQLRGCPLQCPYCYVTPAGIHGRDTQYITTRELVAAFDRSRCNVFHLMGGAPALYMQQWPDLMWALQETVFHSDLLLMEFPYDLGLLREIASFPDSLYAVSIKGGSPAEFKQNTGVDLDEKLLRDNMEKLQISGMPVYYTFTGMSSESITAFKSHYGALADFSDSFAIDLVHYKALDYKK